jgi:uncharacterized membrane protein YkoI
MPLLISVTVGALLPVSMPARAAETRDGPVMVGNKVGKITKEQATQSALAALPGEVTDVTVEKKRGKNVWVIEIVAAKTGAETDVLVDMDSGAVIGMDH